MKGERYEKINWNVLVWYQFPTRSVNMYFEFVLRKTDIERDKYDLKTVEKRIKIEAEKLLTITTTTARVENWWFSEDLGIRNDSQRAPQIDVNK